MKKNRLFLIISILLLCFTSIFGSYSVAYAADNSSNELNEAETYKLFIVNEEIEVGESLLLKPGAIVYGILEATELDTVSIQFENRNIKINMDKLIELEEVSDLEVPEFVSFSEEELAYQDFNQGDFLYSTYDNGNPYIEFLMNTQHLVSNSDTVVIGNVSYNLTLDDDSEKPDSEDNSDSTDVIDDDFDSDQTTVEEEEQVDQNNSSETPNTETEIINEQADDNAVNTELTNKEIQMQQNSSTNNLELTNGGFSPSDKYFKALKDMPVYDNRSGKLVEVGTIKKGQIYPRYESSPKWHMIQFEGYKAFVEKDGTEPASGNSLKNINTDYNIVSNKINISKDVTVYDNTSGQLVPFGVINKGQEYKVSHDYGGAWIIIVFADRVGYVKTSDVQRVIPSYGKYFRVTSDRIPVYDNRSGKLIKVGELEKGQSYPRYEGSPQWHQIQFGDYRAYVHKGGTEPTNGSNIKNYNNEYKNQSKKIVAKRNITVYDNSSGTLVPFGKIMAGESYSIARDYGGKWIYIIFADRVGFVDSSDVAREFSSTDKYFRVTGENVPVYDNRSGMLIEVGRLNKGQVFPRYDASPQWHQIQFGNYKAYVRKGETEPINGNSIKGETEIKYKKQQGSFIATKDTLVYSSKNTPYALIKEGQVYPYTLDYGGSLIYITFSDRVGLVKKSDVKIQGIKESNYNLTLNEALQIQMKANPQTDAKYAWVSKTYIGRDNKVTATNLNVRLGPGANYDSVGTISQGTSVRILDDHDGWYAIEYNPGGQWRHAGPTYLRHYLDPNNFINDARLRFQFLDLAITSGATAAELNNYLRGKGTLQGQGQAFIDGGRIHGVNDVYLISHATLETGHGTSSLASGVEVGKNRNGVTTMVTSANRSSLTDIKKVYNMFGINANDSCPLKCGSERAYDEGWTTIEKAIIGGAKFIGNDYINIGQNTLYKMRWNYALVGGNYVASHQYATDIGWAAKQVSTMYNLYRDLSLTNVYLDIPVYKK